MIQKIKDIIENKKRVHRIKRIYRGKLSLSEIDLDIRKNIGPEDKDWEGDKEDRKGYFGNSVIYVDIPGERLIDNILNRRSRPHEVWKEKLMPKVLLLLEQKGYLKDSKKESVYWDEYAGCSMCPCSPGFKVSYWRGYTVWMKLKDKKEVDGNKKSS